MPEKLLYSKIEACEALRYSLRSLTAAMTNVELPAVVNARRVYISAADLGTFATRGRPTLGSTHRRPNHPLDSHSSPEAPRELTGPFSSGTREPQRLETKDQLTLLRTSDRIREGLLRLRSQGASAEGE
jgi:hypothetical protein